MNIQEELRKFCLEQAVNKAAIAAAIADRMYPDAAPQKIRDDHVVVKEVDDVPFEHLQGYSGLTETRVQLDCKSTSSASACAIRELLRIALEGHRGTFGNVWAEGISVAGRSGGEEVPIDASDVHRYVRSIDLIISHT